MSRSRKADPSTPAQAGWLAAQSVGELLELIAALPVPEDRARAMVCAAAEGIARVSVLQEECADPASHALEEMRTRIARSSTTVFDEWARDAAASFGNADAARITHETLAAIIEGIRIIDDIQDGEESCLATRIGTARALNVAISAFAHALECAAVLRLPSEPSEPVADEVHCSLDTTSAHGVIGAAALRLPREPSEPSEPVAEEVHRSRDTTSAHGVIGAAALRLPSEPSEPVAEEVHRSRDTTSAHGLGGAAALRLPSEPSEPVADEVHRSRDTTSAHGVTGPTRPTPDTPSAHGLTRPTRLTRLTRPTRPTPWQSAATAIGRGIRETAIGQELETQATANAESFWSVVDRKTPPLVATALELGALSAGATPRQAASLTQLAVPLGRVLQIGDDCIDALELTATDWRKPHLNLLWLFSLTGPHGAELEALLRNASDPAVLREAQMFLLKDGALSYAIHARLATLDAIEEIVLALDLPDRSPFLRQAEFLRNATIALQTTSAAPPAAPADALPARALPA